MRTGNVSSILTSSNTGVMVSWIIPPDCKSGATGFGSSNLSTPTPVCVAKALIRFCNGYVGSQNVPVCPCSALSAFPVYNGRKRIRLKSRKGCRSRFPAKFMPVAQLEEYRSPKPRVAGSSPAWHAISACYAS